MAWFIEKTISDSWSQKKNDGARAAAAGRVAAARLEPEG
jgi:hypothetical protein